MHGCQATARLSHSVMMTKENREEVERLGYPMLGPHKLQPLKRSSLILSLPMLDPLVQEGGSLA